MNNRHKTTCLALSLVAVSFLVHVTKFAQLNASLFQGEFFNGIIDFDLPIYRNATSPISIDHNHETEEGDNKPSTSRRRLVVAGTARNNGRHLDRVLKTILRIVEEGSFELYRCVFYENDSDDDTLAVLQSWALKDASLKDKVDVISEKNVTSTQRTVTLARGRNRLWERFKELDKEKPIDFILMLDMDDVNNDLKGVAECFQLPAGGWGACCANQYRIYYDLWALRTFDDWVDCDVMVNNCNMTLDEKLLKFRHIPASTPPIHVRSCFGGAVLYQYQQIKKTDARYFGEYRGGELNGTRICEHVPFHEAIQRSNPAFKLYIQPRMLNEKWPLRPKVIKRLQLEIAKSHADPNISHYYVRPQ